MRKLDPGPLGGAHSCPWRKDMNKLRAVLFDSLQYRLFGSQVSGERLGANHCDKVFACVCGGPIRARDAVADDKRRRAAAAAAAAGGRHRRHHLLLSGGLPSHVRAVQCAQGRGLSHWGLFNQKARPDLERRKGNGRQRRVGHKVNLQKQAHAYDQKKINKKKFRCSTGFDSLPPPPPSPPSPVYSPAFLAVTAFSCLAPPPQTSRTA